MYLLMFLDDVHNQIVALQYRFLFVQQHRSYAATRAKVLFKAAFADTHPHNRVSKKER